jgi:tRNA (adenine37-N6)-methyltransferase
MEIIAHIRSDFPDRFGIPRQAGQAPSARAVIELLPPYDRPEAVRGLGDCSHVWVLFLCHKAEGWKPTVRPPRLGGNRRVGVFASRSPFRPNPIGLSAVRLEGIDLADGVRLHVSGGDFLDGTPVLDIKPYLPWADALADATGGIGAEAPTNRLPVHFDETCKRALDGLPEGSRLRALIEESLSLDPRPAYHDEAAREYAMRIAGVDVRWRLSGETIEVIGLATESGRR